MILLTGASGGVASLLRLEGPVRRTDVVAHPSWPDLVVGDLADPAFARSVAEGADAIVHLAAQADPVTPWAGLRTPNGDVTANVLDAAVAVGVPRVILASSLHAVAGHVDAGRTFVGEDLPPHACCAYGASKVLGEQLARCYTDVWGLRVLCLRLGGVRDRPLGLSWRGGWLSPADLNRLFAAALTADVPYGVYHGVSNNTPQVYGYSLPGYAPQDDSASFPDLPDDLTPPPADRPRWGIAHRS
ncbi:NAD-dependent epimerase/dehydratase family protein [Dactylosporangium sp. NPDC048998]|uniref:NAD-dependent epimerase/dehydratase family protein n=1 Tax=Dactylosporangium sp. NPDC048998 TaxID=3363976 RepID=UPI0037218EB9